MAIDPKTIVDESSTMPANSEPAPADTSGLPEEILAMPVFAGLLNGAPSAIWVETGSKAPEATAAVRAGKALNAAGLFFERSKDEGIDVLYNAMELPPEVVEKAKKDGKLKTLASPLSEVNAQFQGAVSGTPAGAAPMAAGPSGISDSPLNTARRENLLPGSPTSGESPGAGRVLNSLQKNVL